MGESLSTTIDNYDSSIEKEKELAEIIKGATLEEGDIAKDVISKTDAAKLAGLIETNFKSDGVWKRYGDMKKDSFYNFYVEATIDLLSDKLLDNDGNEKKFSFNGKDGTLDDHLKDLNGIDNNYSRDLVKLAQKAMGIKESQQDGLAGPQFFAKVCSILEGKETVDDFKVQGYDNDSNVYRFNFDETTSSNNNLGIQFGSRTEIQGNNHVETINGKKINLQQGVSFQTNDIGYPIFYNGHYQNLFLKKLEDGKITIIKGPKYNEDNGCGFELTENNDNSYTLILQPYVKTIENKKIDVGQYKLPNGYGFGDYNRDTNGDESVDIVKQDGSGTNWQIKYNNVNQSIMLNKKPGFNEENDGIFKINNNNELKHYTPGFAQETFFYLNDGYAFSLRQATEVDNHGTNVSFNGKRLGYITTDNANKPKRNCGFSGQKESPLSYDENEKQWYLG